MALHKHRPLTEGSGVPLVRQPVDLHQGGGHGGTQRVALACGRVTLVEGRRGGRVSSSAGHGRAGVAVVAAIWCSDRVKSRRLTGCGEWGNLLSTDCPDQVGER